jgi:hypothetical protein
MALMLSYCSSATISGIVRHRLNEFFSEADAEETAV